MRTQQELSSTFDARPCHDSRAGRDPREKPIPPAWIKPLNDWISLLRASGLSSTTITTRNDHLRRFARAGHDDPFAITEDELVVWLGSPHWSAETRRSIRGSLRSFYSWAHLRGHLPSDPSVELPRVRAGAPQPRPTPEDSYAEALRLAPPREHLMIRLGGEAGLRRAEIAVVHFNDVFRDIFGYSLVVHGKGDKRRVVPLAETLAQELLRWFDVQGRGFAFSGQTNGHLAPGTVGKLISQYLPADYGPHSLRHRFATQIHEIDSDLLTTSVLLGHSSVATTQRYVAPNGSRGRSLVDRLETHNAPQGRHDASHVDTRASEIA